MMENHIFEIQCSKEKAIEKENTLRSSLSKTKRQSECDSIKYENQIKVRVYFVLLIFFDCFINFYFEIVETGI